MCVDELIRLVKTQHGSWCAYEAHTFQPHQCGSDVYDLPQRERILLSLPLILDQDDKYKK